MKRECPFCHEQVGLLEYDHHIGQHTRHLPDGQMEDHITLAPSLQFSGDLQGVPTEYTHIRCGGTTCMPEDIVRTYLIDPHHYNQLTFCAHCGRYVHHRELYWEDTKEGFTEYFARLAREKGPSYRIAYRLLSWYGTGFTAGCLGCVVAVCSKSLEPVSTAMVSAIVGAAVGHWIGRPLRLVLLRKKLIR